MAAELHDRRMDLRIQCLCIDTTDPSRLAGFWEEALGWRRTYDEDDQVALEPPKGSPEDGVAPDLLFLRVPEKKAVKNRLHLDLRPKDQAAEVARRLRKVIEEERLKEVERNRIRLVVTK